MPSNHRPLLAVDIESDFPFQKLKTRFRIRLSEQVNNGYMELRCGRPLKARFLLRKRVDRGTQVTLPKFSKSVQTLNSLKRNQTIQFHYKGPEKSGKTRSLARILTAKLDKFLELTELCDKLIENNRMNLYQDDYNDLKSCNNPEVFQLPSDFKQYQDIKFQRTKVNCMSWNAIISGVVAVAYSRNPLLCVSKLIHIEEVLEPSIEKHIILIWFYKDNLRPKLYLHATSEVTALSFCPYDENILVAGYSNGLVAVWDLTDLLIDPETPIFLSGSEQQYHSLIMQETNWFQRPLGVEHIFPVLTSEFQMGHMSPVTSITWIPPNYYMSDMRRYEECKSGIKHMQFLTVTLDGNKVLVWDLKPDQYHIVQKTKRSKVSRLAELPEGLHQNKSPLHKLHTCFKPVCKLFVSIPTTKSNNNPLMKMVMKNELYHYVPVNPSTLRDLDASTYFRTNRLTFDFDMTQKIIFTTGLGTIQIAFWDGANYKGDITDEECKIESLEVVHDGPILVCEINTYFPEMLLTVGGSVFAIWDPSKTKTALVWRKSSHRFQSGMWCLYQPLSLLVVRTDRCFEIWNICELSNSPIESYKYKGYELIKFYGDSQNGHSRKDTFITTDALGAFRVFAFPSGVRTKPDEDVAKAMEYINRIHELKQHLEALKEKCRQKKIKEAKLVAAHQEPVGESPVKVVPEEEVVPQPVKITNKVKFEKNLQKYMTGLEIKRKKLNMREIKKDSLICLESQVSMGFGSKLHKLNSEEILTVAQKRIFENTYTTKNVWRRFTVNISKEKAFSLKKMYIESFKEIEPAILEVLKDARHSFKGIPSRVIPEIHAGIKRKHDKRARSEMKKIECKVVVVTETDTLHLHPSRF